MGKKKGILEYDSVELVFKPTSKFSYNGTKAITCKATLTIWFEPKMKTSTEWVFSSLSFTDAKKIHDMTGNMASCAINLASNNKKIKEFAQFKSTVLKNIEPKTNWKVFEKWFNTCEEIRKLKKNLKTLERNLTTDDSNIEGDVLEDFFQKMSNREYDHNKNIPF